MPITIAEGRGGEADRQRDARAVDDAGEEIAAEVIDAEPELGRRKGQRLRKECLRGRAGLGEERRKDRGEDQDREQRRRRQRRPCWRGSAARRNRAGFAAGRRVTLQARRKHFRLRCSLPVVSEAYAGIEPGVGDVGDQVGDAEHQRHHQASAPSRADSRGSRSRRRSRSRGPGRGTSPRRRSSRWRCR